ncbi:MAG: Rpn family recombination-promoting nuclease/putative transposase [Gemmatimonadetes bacterium]|nr:Rpn family recombination-promoting nuclease/putative transposase [Gemmatimonadota bacterium]MYF72265.1 Rpn family recombination-promoting nuclease/putative transposase [Gemmatimonadota bacterium]MYK52146.1 Rpn family recombination-promoting nuclease/putative transposase [Gemmatimonadota bacterium]
MAEFDTISKHLIQKYPSDFAGFTLGREDVEVLAVIDTEQLTVEARQTDSLIRVHIDGEEVLVHNEFQTTDSTNPPMPRRMAGYIGHAIRQHGLPIYSNVIYLRPNAGQHDPGHYIQEHLGYEITIRYRVIRLIEIEGERVLNSGDSGLIPFTPLMKPPEGMASDVWLHQCIHTARTRPIARSYRADYLAGMVALSELVYASETISDIIFKEGIMDLIRESSLFQSLTQQSREESFEQGERKSTLEDILEVLEIRFDMSESHPISAHIAAINDLQRLKQLHRSAIQVVSLEAFQHLLDE